MEKKARGGAETGLDGRGAETAKRRFMQVTHTAARGAETKQVRLALDYSRPAQACQAKRRGGAGQGDRVLCTPSRTTAGQTHAKPVNADTHTHTHRSKALADRRRRDLVRSRPGRRGRSSACRAAALRRLGQARHAASPFQTHVPAAAFGRIGSPQAASARTMTRGRNFFDVGTQRHNESKQAPRAPIQAAVDAVPGQQQRGAFAHRVHSAVTRPERR